MKGRPRRDGELRRSLKNGRRSWSLDEGPSSKGRRALSASFWRCRSASLDEGPSSKGRRVEPDLDAWRGRADASMKGRPRRAGEDGPSQSHRRSSSRLDEGPSSKGRRVLEVQVPGPVTDASMKGRPRRDGDRKSTRLNSSHANI